MAIARIIKYVSLWSTLLIGAVAFIGCPETTPVEPDPDVNIEEEILDEKSNRIGPDGGTVTLDDGMSVAVPPGALDETSTVTIQKIGSELYFDYPNRTAYNIEVTVEPDEIELSFPIEPGGTADDIGVLNYDPATFFQTEADPYPFTYDPTTGTVTVVATASGTEPAGGGAGKRSGKIKEKNRWIIEKEPLVEPDVETKTVAMPFYAQDQLTCWAASIHMMTRGYNDDPSSIVPDYLKYAGYPPTTGPGGYMYRIKVPSLLNIYAKSGATGAIYWRGASAFNNIIGQIDSGRPILVGRSGHSVMVIGYKRVRNLYGPTAYDFLIHDPGDPKWSNRWKDWDWLINQSISWTTFAEVWIPSPPREDRPLQTVGMPLSGATGEIRFTHRHEDGGLAYDGTLWIDVNAPKWYGWRKTLSSYTEIPGRADTLFMKLPLWNADLQNAASVSLRITVRKIDEGEVYSTQQFMTLPVGNDPYDFVWRIPVATMRTGTGEPDYRLKVELLKGGSKKLDEFSVEFRLGPPEPVITSVDPDPALVAEPITINGTGFGDDKYAGEVTLGGDRLYDITEWTDTRIKLNLPNSARTGDLIVSVNDVESEPYRLEVKLAEDLLPKLNTSIVAIASFEGAHTAKDGTQFAEIKISSGETDEAVEWNGTTVTLEKDWSVPDGAGGIRKYTFRLNGTVAPQGDSIVTYSVLYSERWEAPDNAFVQIDTKELVFTGVHYSHSVISNDQRFETLIYRVSGASVQSRVSKAVWSITDDLGDVKFTYESTDWQNELAPPTLSVAFGRENK